MTLNSAATAFVQGLAEAGLNPQTIPGKPDHVYFDYRVKHGKFSGQAVRIGCIVPMDFPRQAPTGIHVSPEIHPLRADGTGHPLDGIHKSHSEPFEVVEGGWQYWSRPVLGWRGDSQKDPVAAYLLHVWHLWNTQ